MRGGLLDAVESWFYTVSGKGPDIRLGRFYRPCTEPVQSDCLCNQTNKSLRTVFSYIAPALQVCSSSIRKWVPLMEVDACDSQATRCMGDVPRDVRQLSVDRIAGRRSKSGVARPECRERHGRAVVPAQRGKGVCRPWRACHPPDLSSVSLTIRPRATLRSGPGTVSIV